MFFNTGGGIISDICQGDVDNPDTKDEASSVFSDKLSEKTVPDNTESAKTNAPDPQKEAALSILNTDEEGNPLAGSVFKIYTATLSPDGATSNTSQGIPGTGPDGDGLEWTISSIIKEMGTDDSGMLSLSSAAPALFAIEQASAPDWHTDLVLFFVYIGEDGIPQLLDGTQSLYIDGEQVEADQFTPYGNVDVEGNTVTVKNPRISPSKNTLIHYKDKETGDPIGGIPVEYKGYSIITETPVFDSSITSSEQMEQAVETYMEENSLSWDWRPNSFGGLFTDADGTLTFPDDSSLIPAKGAYCLYVFTYEPEPEGDPTCFLIFMDHNGNMYLFKDAAIDGTSYATTGNVSESLKQEDEKDYYEILITDSSSSYFPFYVVDSKTGEPIEDTSWDIGLYDKDGKYSRIGNGIQPVGGILPFRLIPDTLVFIGDSTSFGYYLIDLPAVLYVDNEKNLTLITSENWASVKDTMKQNGFDEELLNDMDKDFKENGYSTPAASLTEDGALQIEKVKYLSAITKTDSITGKALEGVEFQYVAYEDFTPVRAVDSSLSDITPELVVSELCKQAFYHHRWIHSGEPVQTVVTDSEGNLPIPWAPQTVYHIWESSTPSGYEEQTVDFWIYSVNSWLYLMDDMPINEGRYGEENVRVFGIDRFESQGDITFDVCENEPPYNSEDYLYVHTEITVRNTPLAGLSVSKSVKGNPEDKDKEFHFRLILDNDTVTGEYGDLTFENGQAEFTLKDGETVAAENLPNGISYTVTEDDYSADGYETSSENASGTTVGGEVTEVRFVNTFHFASEPAQTPEDKDDQNPQTGDRTHISLVLLGLTCSGMIILLLHGRSKKQR